MQTRVLLRTPSASWVEEKQKNDLHVEMAVDADECEPVCHMSVEGGLGQQHGDGVVSHARLQGHADRLDADLQGRWTVGETTLAFLATTCSKLTTALQVKRLRHWQRFLQSRTRAQIPATSPPLG